MAKFTLEQICEKMECTVQDIAEAIVAQSKNNQRIIAEAKKENNLKVEEEKSNLRAIEAQNNRLRALIDNHNLTNEWGEIVRELNSQRAEAEKKEQKKTTKPTLAEQPQVRKPTLKIVKS